MVEELMDYMKHEFRATRAKIESDLGKGLARSLEDYRLYVGRIRGLNEAEEIMAGCYKRLSLEEDEAERGDD